MHTSKTLTMAAIAGLLGVSLLYAQSGRAPRLDPATAVTLEGPVVSFTSDLGRPSTLVVDDAEMGKTIVRLGPAWYLEGIGFTAAAGDSVVIEARQCADCAAGQVAIWVQNQTTGAIAELREEDGRPVWRGAGRRQAVEEPESGHRYGRGRGRGGHGCGQCPCARG